MSGPPPSLALTQTFAAEQLVLRLPEGDCLVLDASARTVLAAARAGRDELQLAAELAPHLGLSADQSAALVRDTLAPLRDRLDRMSATGLAADTAPPPFVSPGWRPPAQHTGRDFPSLPRRRPWWLLVAATARQPEASAALDRWREAVAAAALAPGETHHRLKALIAANLASHGTLPLDASATAVARRHWLQTATGLQRLAPLLHQFHAAGLRVAILKGLATAVLDYRDLALRPMNDFDLVVPFADRARAIALLTAAGFQAHNPCHEADAGRVHGGAYVLAGQLNLDLHWHTLWCNCWDGADARFWSEVRPIELAGAPCFVPSPEFRFLFACAHGFRHAEIPAHYWIADAAMILTRAGQDFDWSRVLAEARARRLTRLLREACRFLDEAMGAALPPTVLAALAAAPTAIFEDRIFESFQQARPGGGAASRAVDAWLKQYRSAARGFRPAEILDFLQHLRRHRSRRSLPRFLLHLSGRALTKVWHQWGRPIFSRQR